MDSSKPRPLRRDQGTALPSPPMDTGWIWRDREDHGFSLAGSWLLLSSTWLAIGVFDVLLVELAREYSNYGKFVLIGPEPRLLKHLLMLPLVWAGAAYLFSVGRSEQPRWMTASVALLVAAAIGMAERFVRLFAMIIVDPGALDATAAEKIASWFVGDYAVWVISGAQCAFEFLIAMLVVMARASFVRELHRQRLENELRESGLRARLAALQNELSPHFMFNALHHAVARTPDGGTRTMLVDLAELLRYVLRGRAEPTATVAEEVEFSQGYLALCAQQGASVATTWTVSPEAGRAMVPRMLLHMLVENAFRHACELRGAGWIDVRVAVEQDRLTLEATNGFVPGTTVAGTGIGLRNVRERLAILFGDHVVLEAGAVGPATWRTSAVLPLELEP